MSNSPLKIITVKWNPVLISSPSTTTELDGYYAKIASSSSVPKKRTVKTAKKDTDSSIPPRFKKDPKFVSKLYITAYRAKQKLERTRMSVEGLQRLKTGLSSCPKSSLKRRKGRPVTATQVRARMTASAKKLNQLLTAIGQITTNSALNGVTKP
jgi:hypothetical protein